MRETPKASRSRQGSVRNQPWGRPVKAKVPVLFSPVHGPGLQPVQLVFVLWTWPMGWMGQASGLEQPHGVQAPL